MIVASIVAGEVGSTVPQARQLVACQVRRDAAEGRHLPSRWYGWRRPSQGDIEAAERALDTDVCEWLPTCRFLGNEQDLQVWMRAGYVKRDAPVLRIINGQFAAVCVLDGEWPAIRWGKHTAY